MSRCNPEDWDDDCDRLSHESYCEPRSAQAALGIFILIVAGLLAGGVVAVWWCVT